MIKMKVFYLWLKWKGLNHALFMFRATKKGAQEWFNNLPVMQLKNKYHLLECQDDMSVKTEFPEPDDLRKLSLSFDTNNDYYVQIKNDDGTYTRLTQLQEAFEMAFKRKQPLTDSRDLDGKSWRDRPRLF